MNALRRAGASVCALLALVLPACSAAPGPARPSAQTSAPDTPAAVPTAEPTAAPPASASGEFTLVVAGDVHFADRTARLLNDPPNAFGPVADVLRSADLTVVNLETAVTDRGVPEPKEFHFRTTPRAFNALAGAGIDAVTLANNHTLDYGRIGLLDTLDAAQHAGFPAFGAGRNAAEAYKPWTTTVHGVRVAALGFMQVHELEVPWAAQDNRPGIAEAFDIKRALAAVRTARESADLVIVFNHWGTQGVACANAEQKAFAAALSAAGADIIVGSHAHVLQGSGWLGHSFVAYGMANFLWYGNSYSTETGVLRLSVRGRSVVKSEFLPAVVSGTGQPTLLTGAAAEALSKRYAGLRGCAGLANQSG